MHIKSYIFITCLFLFSISTRVLAEDTPPSNDIIVNGTRWPAPRIFDYVVPGIITTDNNIVLFAGDDGNPVTDIHACTRKNAMREAGKDRLSDDFRNALAGKPDSNAREYATLLIMDSSDSNNSTFRFEPVTAGSTWAEATAAGDDAPKVIIPAPVSKNYEYIVGIIHNHPPVGDPNPLDNRLPSSNDWATYATLKTAYPPSAPSGTKVAPEYAFSHYIVGPDGVVREYRQDAGFPKKATTGIKNRC